MVVADGRGPRWRCRVVRPRQQPTTGECGHRGHAQLVGARKREALLPGGATVSGDPDLAVALVDRGCSRSTIRSGLGRLSLVDRQAEGSPPANGVIFLALRDECVWIVHTYGHANVGAVSRRALQHSGVPLVCRPTTHVAPAMGARSPVGPASPAAPRCTAMSPHSGSVVHRPVTHQTSGGDQAEERPVTEVHLGPDPLAPMPRRRRTHPRRRPPRPRSPSR